MHAYLKLEDGTLYPGQSFGDPRSVSGECVFNTGMTGYTETLTDPSYKGEIVVLTSPLVGNYGIPKITHENHLAVGAEAPVAHVSGLVVSDYSMAFSHWQAVTSLGDWLKDQKVPAIFGVDTRALTKRLREKGTMLGQIICNDQPVAFHDPNQDDLVAQVSIPEPILYKGGPKHVVLIDCGCKANILRSLLSRGLTVTRIPWDADPLAGADPLQRNPQGLRPPDGIVISNGPGDPKRCVATIENIRRAMRLRVPIFGICLGHQLLALAAGADTYKLKYGHRGQNQPCIQVASRRCFITSQNHGFAVDDRTLPDDWEHWFFNANDSTNEGIRHKSLPFMSVQFHPEGAPGPTDTAFLFDEFVKGL